MKDKHLKARIAYCLAIAECSTCPRRRPGFGAVLFDPKTNVDLCAGYNGPPRGGPDGGLCGPDGKFCVRDGVTRQDVEVRYIPDDWSRHGRDYDPAHFSILVRGKEIYSVAIPEGQPGESKEACKAHALAKAEAYVDEQLVAKHLPIPSGQQLHIGCHHAEANCITNAARLGIKTEGCYLVVNGEPCLACAKLLHHAGIHTVYVVKGGYLGGDDGPEYLRQNNVRVVYVEGPPDPRSEKRDEPT